MEHTFTNWLQQEVLAARCSLLTLLEQQDRLRYQEAPELEEAYMKEVGTYEEEVLREELENEILQKKQQMIQTALNRREPIDEASIDRALDEYRQEVLKEAAGEEPRAFVALSDGEAGELQLLYRTIVKEYHPQTHPDLPQVHRELFEKAQTAYRFRDLAALRLIYEMLSAGKEEDLVDVLAGMVAANMAPVPAEAMPPLETHLTDYSLAAKLYECFRKTEADAILIEERDRYQQEAEKILKKIEKLRNEFPFNAEKMLSDPQQIEAYRQDLSHRMYTAKQEQSARQKEISQMMKGAQTHG